jgi:hypothetical protein
MPMQDMKKEVLSASHRYAILYGSKHSAYKKDPWMSYSKPVALAYINFCVQLCSRQPNVTSRCYDWWKKSQSSEEGE